MGITDKMANLKLLSIVASSCLYIYWQASLVEGGYAPTWGYCDCSWNGWKAWESCTKDCYGTRVRERSVRAKQNQGCNSFAACASPDMALQYQACNQNCHNGGTPMTSSCNCRTGYTGQCCGHAIDCGPPTSIANGGVSNTGTLYGSTSTYSCDMHYNLTDGSRVRICQTNKAWSGTLPRCAYVNHCSSQPCQNGATCTDLLDDYSCTCEAGWSGQHCDVDIQPPVMQGCPSDIVVNATNSTIFIDWGVPSFIDPLGNELDFTNNYPSPQFTFPWGDFVVQYTATKRNNGLSTECVFSVRVRPTPCEDLNIPTNGSRICNNWQTDYGRFCLVACERDYMISPPNRFGTLYTCGASGNWIAAAPLPDCDVPVTDVADAQHYHPNFLNYTYEGSCTDSTSLTDLQEAYIDRLCGEFRSFCTTYEHESVASNVAVDCI